MQVIMRSRRYLWSREVDASQHARPGNARGLCRLLYREGHRACDKGGMTKTVATVVDTIKRAVAWSICPFAITR